jgi:hypothetical protein
MWVVDPEFSSNIRQGVSFGVGSHSCCETSCKSALHNSLLFGVLETSNGALQDQSRECNSGSHLDNQKRDNKCGVLHNDGRLP